VPSLFSGKKKRSK